jgi:hypothetical protein
MPWPEFSWFVGGLFSADTRLRRHFAPPDETEQPSKEG